MTIFGPVPYFPEPLSKQIVFVIVLLAGLFVIEVLGKRVGMQSRRTMLYVELSFMVFTCIILGLIAVGYRH